MAANDRQIDWRFWQNWGLAFLGFPLGGLAALGVAGGIETAWDGVLGGLAGGAVIGGLQRVALRSYLHLSPAWAVATSVGMAAGLGLSTALLGIDTASNALLMRGALTGSSVGAAQWLVLRQGHGSYAAVWVPTVALAWALGWAVTRAAGVDLSPNFANFGSTGAWAFQLVTGLVLVWLLGRGPKVGLHLAHR